MNFFRIPKELLLNGSEEAGLSPPTPRHHDCTHPQASPITHTTHLPPNQYCHTSLLINTHSPLVEIMIGVHGPVLAVVLIPILAGRVDVFTSRLRTKTYVETNRIISTHHNLQSLHTAFDWPLILDSGTTWDTLT